MSETVKGWVQTESEIYKVWVPDDLADQLADSDNLGWVSLALIDSDEYISLQASNIIFFRREMTAAEKQRRHTLRLTLETS